MIKFIKAQIQEVLKTTINKEERMHTYVDHNKTDESKRKLLKVAKK